MVNLIDNKALEEFVYIILYSVVNYVVQCIDFAIGLYQCFLIQ
jgi:hypothetical protein